MSSQNPYQAPGGYTSNSQTAYPDSVEFSVAGTHAPIDFLRQLKIDRPISAQKNFPALWLLTTLGVLTGIGGSKMILPFAGMMLLIFIAFILIKFWLQKHKRDIESRLSEREFPELRYYFGTDGIRSTTATEEQNFNWGEIRKVRVDRELIVIHVLYESTVILVPKRWVPEGDQWLALGRFIQHKKLTSK